MWQNLRTPPQSPLRAAIIALLDNGVSNNTVGKAGVSKIRRDGGVLMDVGNTTGMFTISGGRSKAAPVPVAALDDGDVDDDGDDDDEVPAHGGAGSAYSEDAPPPPSKAMRTAGKRAATRA